MINYTTPTIMLTIKGMNLSSFDAYITLKQGVKILTKSGDDLTVTTQTEEGQTNTIISFTLTQKETASFHYDASVEIQANWVSEEGERLASTINKISVFKNLLNEVIA